MVTLSLLALALFGTLAGAALLLRPERAGEATGNLFWLRSPRRRAAFRYAGGLGFLALGAAALLDLAFDSITIFPGD